MKVSFIATVYNEESTIKPFLESLFSQSKFPDEIIIVDGGSTDNTISEISNFKFPTFKNKVRIKLIFKKGNRSVGRNEAIKKSSNEIIACSDAGCILDNSWIKNIVKPFINSRAEVVSGYYEGKSNSIFEKCLVPYVLVMPDRINTNNFLPASRSMAFKKSIWEKAGGFPEEFSNNEDFVFAQRLKKINAKIIFEKNAIVHWIPRKNVKEAFTMFYRFAKGDAESHIFRPKVFLIFLRYIVGLLLVSFYLMLKSYVILNTLYLMLGIYVFWSIVKNYKYVNNLRATFYLPLLQFISDIAIISGTLEGIISFCKLQPDEHHQQ